MTRSEKEKMLAGESYNCLDPALSEEREQAKALFRRYNLAETPEERQRLLHQLIGKVGENTLVEPPFYCSYGQNTQLGDYVYLNYACTILDNNVVRLGNHVMVGPNAQFYTAAHPLEVEPRTQGLETAKAIVVEDNVWIGGGAILLPGVHIGQNAVVGAGAVVTRDVPPNTVVAGNPARVIKQIEN